MFQRMSLLCAVGETSCPVLACFFDCELAEPQLVQAPCWLIFDVQYIHMIP